MPREFDYVLVVRFSAAQAVPGGPVVRAWTVSENGTTKDTNVTPPSEQRESEEVIAFSDLPPALQGWLNGRIAAKRSARNAT